MGTGVEEGGLRVKLEIDVAFSWKTPPLYAEALVLLAWLEVVA